MLNFHKNPEFEKLFSERFFVVAILNVKILLNFVFIPFGNPKNPTQIHSTIAVQAASLLENSHETFLRCL